MLRPRDWIWLVLPYPGEKLGYYVEAKELLKLTRGGAWNIYPASELPEDWHARYSEKDISHLENRC